VIKQFREAQKLFKTIQKNRRARDVSPVWIDWQSPGKLRFLQRLLSLHRYDSQI